MKKFLSALITLISFVSVNAQSKEKGTIEITPKIGSSNFHQYYNGDRFEFNLDSNSGVAFGATADYYLNNRWSLRSGLVFNKMGFKYNFFVAREEKLNYLSIPLNANWHFGSTRKWNLNFGFSPSFLLNAELIDSEGNHIKIPKSDLKSFQLGLTFGIGYKIEITKKFGILLDYQFFEGLTNINKASSENIINAGGSLNVGGVIQL